MQQTVRRVVAVLAADVAGYTRLTEAAEVATHTRLMRLRTDVIDAGMAEFRGTIVKNTGDGFLAMFDAAEDAAQCAVALQQRLARATADQPAALRIRFRMAINLADAIIEANDIYGDGVNVAARLQAYAEPGSVIVSGAVMELLGRDGPGAGATDLGVLPLRNHAGRMQAFALRTGPTDGAARQLADAAPDADSRPSVAVLPFRMSPPDPAGDYFADGIVDDIIVSLSGLKELFVIQRGSTLNVGRAGISDPVAVGRRLGVRYVLHGAVQREATRLRIRTELIEVEPGTVIGGDRYEGAPDELFDLQDRISLKLVKTIAPSVRERELRRALRKHPQSMTAYDLLLQALDLLYRMDDDSFGRARGLLQQAMAQDPGYAPPHIWASLWHVFRVGEMGATDAEAEAAAAARHAAAAVERNGNDPMALAMHGHVQSFLLKDYASARYFLDRATDAGPSAAMAWTMSAATRGYVGEGALAVAEAARGVRLSPSDPYLFWHEGILANAHYVAGDFDAAVAWSRSAVAQNPAIRFTHRTWVASLAAAGRIEEARQAAAQLLRLLPGFRLGPYARVCPFVPGIIEGWIGHLRLAGLPE